MTIETEVAALTLATTTLLSAVNVAKATLDTKVSQATTQAGYASASANAASASQSSAASSATTSASAMVAAQAALASAVAVVTGGTASLLAAPGKLPIAGGYPGLDPTWLAIAIADLFTVNQLLFDAGQVGGNLSLTDFSKIWQDSAGTTPYTAVEQYVGKIIDKSPNALAFTQATSAARPVVSARMNLLTNTALSGFVAGSPGTPPTGWANSQVTGDIAAGTSGGLKFILNNTRRTITQVPTVLANTSYLYRIKVNVIVPHAKFFPANSLRAISAGATISLTSWSIDGAAFTTGSEVLSTGVHTVVMRLDVGATGGGVYIVFGSGAVDAVGAVGEIDIWEPQVVLLTRANLPYQYVNTSTDYATAGFPNYEKFDGIDDNLVSVAGGGGTAGIYFCGAIQFNKVGAIQVVWSDAGTNSGYELRLTSANKLGLIAGDGSALYAANTVNTFSAGDVLLCEAWDDGTNLGVRLGEGTPVTVVRPIVTAGTAQITLGKANNASTLYACINMFEPVWRYGAMPNATQREAIRAICRSKAGIV